jgi:soluble lytic murein transglycosylase
MGRGSAAARCAALGAAALLAVAAAALARGASPAPAPEAALAAAARTAFEGRLEEAIAAVHPLATDAAVTEGVRARANFLLGVLLLRAGRPAEAAAPLEAGGGDPVLADYALARLGLARRAAGDPKGATRALARLLASYPASPLADPAWRDLGRAALEAGDLPSGEAALREALARARTTAVRAEVQLLLAEGLGQAGRPAEAAPLLRDLWLTMPAAREADRAVELLQTLPGAPSSFSDDERFQRAMRLYRGGAYAKAARELTPFAAEAGPRAAQARLALGIARFQAREYAEAIRTLEPFLGEPGGSGRAEVLFWLARCHGRLGDRARSLALLEELVATAPNHRRADEALLFLAAGYIEEGRGDRAADAFERLMRLHPQSDRFETALWGRGWLWYREGQYARAAGAFRKLAGRAAGWRAQAGYWEGRALEAAGRPAEARRLYAELTRGYDAYYARLARARLGNEAPPGVALPPGAAGNRPGGEKTAAGAPADRGRLAVARALAALWLADEASEEYAALVRERPEDRALVAEAVNAALRLQRMDRALALAKRVLWPQYAQSGGTPPIAAFWDALYPQGYWNLVADRTAALRLDPYLVLALIREESGFAPQAVSPVGARGLMQLMPSTAARLAGAHRLPAPGAGLAIEEPWYNITLGTAELADLLDEFKGDFALVLAGYNAGPHHVRRWIRERGYAGPEEFVEEIPFEETRGYVKRVLGSYDRYRALYAQSQVPSPKSQVERPGSGTRDGQQ